MSWLKDKIEDALDVEWGQVFLEILRMVIIVGVCWFLFHRGK